MKLSSSYEISHLGFGAYQSYGTTAESASRILHAGLFISEWLNACERLYSNINISIGDHSDEMREQHARIRIDDS